jgi:hypothetical protein
MTGWLGGAFALSDFVEVPAGGIRPQLYGRRQSAVFAPRPDGDAAHLVVVGKEFVSNPAAGQGGIVFHWFILKSGFKCRQFENYTSSSG